MNHLIEICEVSKQIEGNEILKDINLTIREGSIFGLIGPNGAGKTTLIKLLTGIWLQDKGSIKYHGESVFENCPVKEKIGYVPDFCHYYESFRVKEILKLYEYTYKHFNKDRFQELNRFFGVSQNKRISGLSKGTKAKLSLMLSLSIMPEFLILDEPTSGLDPIAKRKFIEVMVDEVSERNTTVLISTHNLSDVEQFCDSIAVLEHGQIKFHGSIENMKQKVKKLQVVFNKTVPEEILKSKEIISTKNIGSVYYLIIRDYSIAFHEKLQSAGALLIEEISLDLEETFIYSFGGEEAYAHLTK